MFSFDEIKQHIEGFDYEAVDIKGTMGAVVDCKYVLEAAKLLKSKYNFLQLIDAFGVDRNTRKMRFEVTYNLRNHLTFERLFLKVRCDERDPHVPSLVSVWTGANWNEREAFDMYGIIFDGHPDLRRMYMPEEYEHFPMRKDFPLLGIPGSIPLPAHPDSNPRFNIPDYGE